MKPAHERPVAIEDLLRLKQTERPAEDFWLQFDRQLRAKQLAALVNRPPWWQAFTLARLLAGFRRYPLPLGAAAAIALAAVAISWRQPERTRAERLGGVPAVAVQPESAPASINRLATASVHADAEVVVPEATVVPAAGKGAAAAVSEAAAVSRSVSHLIPLLGVPREDRPEGTASLAPIYVDATFGPPAVEDVLVGHTLLSSAARLSRVEARAVTARPAVEPLQQITPPSERRGTRILTAMVSMASVENAMRATERAASRLSEEQLYEQIQRFGARGAGVNVKF